MMIIGIAGGSGSGKTTVVKAITEQLKENVVVIPQDAYYKDLGHLTAHFVKRVGDRIENTGLRINDRAVKIK